MRGVQWTELLKERGFYKVFSSTHKLCKQIDISKYLPAEAVFLVAKLLRSTNSSVSEDSDLFFWRLLVVTLTTLSPFSLAGAGAGLGPGRGGGEILSVSSATLGTWPRASGGFCSLLVW